MSRTMTISSWPSSKTTRSTSVGSPRSPAVISSYMRATRPGVSRRPSRSTSSPMPSRISRTPCSTLAMSKPGAPPSTRAAGSGSSNASATALFVGLSGSNCGRSVRREGVLGVGDAGLALRAAAVGVAVAGARGHDPARGPLHHRGENLAQLPLADGLLLDQHVDHLVVNVTVSGEDLLCLQVRLVDQPPHLLVDLERHLLRVVLLVAEVAPEEDVLLLGPEDQRAEPVAHAVLAHHLAGELGRLLDVVGGSGGGVEEPQLLGHATAQEHRQLVDHLGPGHQELVLDRQR